VPCLLQWRGSSVNVRQSARATHPGMHMPSGHRAHRSLHISRGECCESDAAGHGCSVIISRHAATPRKIAWSSTTHHHHHHHHQHHPSHAAKASVSTSHKSQGSTTRLPQNRKQNRISVHIRTPMSLHSILLNQKICNSELHNGSVGRWWEEEVRCRLGA
jgi:hypothetical protein